MSDIHDLFPELEPMQHGDPFITETVKYDDLIDDYESSNRVDDVDDATAARVVKAITDTQRCFELDTLARWWRLDEEQR
jgi:hypothetical protein